MVDYERMNTFINKVFNYYNGKINKFSKAQLFIEFINKDLIAATTKVPNIITVYPLSVLKYTNNEYYIYYILLESIIHELYHIDQIIDYPRTMIDINYMIQIEYAVEKETNIYLANHRQEIIEEFGIDVYMNPKLIDNINKYSIGIYHRKRINDHINGILKEINAALPIQNKIKNIDLLLQKIKNLLDINGKVYLIFNDNIIVNLNDDINSFNNTLYNTYFIYDLPSPYNIIINEDTINKIIKINIYYNPKRKMIY